jgi:hypothetical protein
LRERKLKRYTARARLIASSRARPPPRSSPACAATTAATAALDMAADGALIAAINRANAALETRPFGEWLKEARS